MVRLVKPSFKYRDSYLVAAREFQKIDGEKCQDFFGVDLKNLRRDFKEYVRKFKDREQGVNLPKGWVTSSEYWLVDGERYIGRSNFRHKLTPKLRIIGGHIGYAIRPSCRKKGYGSLILKLTLKKARLLGLKKAMITCNALNIGSRKIIEKNGGKLFSQGKLSNGVFELRFWINLK